MARKRQSVHCYWCPKYFGAFWQLRWGILVIYIQNHQCLGNAVSLSLEMHTLKGSASGLNRILCYLQYLACTQSPAGTFIPSCTPPLTKHAWHTRPSLNQALHISALLLIFAPPCYGRIIERSGAPKCFRTFRQLRRLYGKFLIFCNIALCFSKTCCIKHI